MDYGMIGKIDKAKRYAQEPERFHFENFSLVFHGDNNDHKLSYAQGKWDCDCEFFKRRSVCSHTMALERMLEKMLVVKEVV